MRYFSVITRLITVTIIAGAVASCQTVDNHGLIASSAVIKISSPAANGIAGDMVTRFAEQIGPGAGTILLKSDGSPFGQALEVSLKNSGYAVATNQTTAGATTIPLAYTIVSHDSQILARLSTSRVDIGRAYSTTITGATPASPLSIMQRD